LNHTRINSAQQDTSCKPGKPPSTHTKLEKDQTTVLAQPCLPQTPSPSFKHKQKAQRIDPSSIFISCNLYDHERESFHKFPDQFRTKKLSTDLSFKNYSFYS